MRVAIKSIVLAIILGTTLSIQPIQAHLTEDTAPPLGTSTCASVMGPLGPIPTDFYWRESDDGGDGDTWYWMVDGVRDPATAGKYYETEWTGNKSYYDGDGDVANVCERQYAERCEGTVSDGSTWLYSWVKDPSLTYAADPGVTHIKIVYKDLTKPNLFTVADSYYEGKWGYCRNAAGGPPGGRDVEIQACGAVPISDHCDPTGASVTHIDGFTNV